MAKTRSNPRGQKAAPRTAAQEQQLKSLTEQLVLTLEKGDQNDLRKAHAAGSIASVAVEQPTQFGATTLAELSVMTKVKKQMIDNYLRVFRLFEDYDSNHPGKALNTMLGLAKPHPLYNVIQVARIKEEKLRMQMLEDMLNGTAPTSRPDWDKYYRTKLNKSPRKARMPSTAVGGVRKMEAVLSTADDLFSRSDETVNKLKNEKDPQRFEGSLDAVRDFIAKAQSIMATLPKVIANFEDVIASQSARAA